MDHQKGDHPKIIQTEPIRLTLGRLDGDDQISQERRVQGGSPPFSHRESEDIGGFVPVKVTPIQFLNLGIVNEKDAQLRFRKFQGGQYLVSCLSYFFEV